MANISSLGIGSGLDLDSLVTQLVNAERNPVKNRLDLKEARAQASISAFGSLKSSLSALQEALGGLKDTKDFTTRSALSSNSDIFTATADNSAALGSTDINVLNLSKTHKLASADFAGPSTVVGTGTLAISNGAGSFSVAISSGDLTDIKDSINKAESNDIVTASIITIDDGSGGTVSKLVLTANESGTDNALEVAVTDDDGVHNDASGLSQLHFQEGDANNQLTSIVVAEDAQITVDGFTTTSSNNIFDSVIEGVSITAVSETEDPINDPPSVLTIATNKSAIEGKVKTFVTEYNAFAEILNTLSSFDADSGESGLLNGDSTLRTIENQIRRVLFGSVNGISGTLRSLSSLGITTTETGQLEINSDQLDDALTNNFEEIANLFASENGIAKELDGLLTQVLSSSGPIKAREDGNKATLEDIEDQRIRLEQRVADVEKRFRQQFASLDILIGELNSTANFLTQQLANANKLTTRNTSLDK